MGGFREVPFLKEVVLVAVLPDHRYVLSFRKQQGKVFRV